MTYQGPPEPHWVRRAREGQRKHYPIMETAQYTAQIAIPTVIGYGVGWTGKEALSAIGAAWDVLDFGIVPAMINIDRTVTNNPAVKAPSNIDEILSKPWERLFGRNEQNQTEFIERVQNPDNPHEHEQYLGDHIGGTFMTFAIVAGALYGTLRGGGRFLDARRDSIKINLDRTILASNADIYLQQQEILKLLNTATPEQKSEIEQKMQNKGEQNENI